MNSKLIKFIVAAGVATTLTGCVAGNDKEASAWQCEAEGLVNARYNGSDYAYVHLQGYSRGENYKVSMNSAGTKATGKTGNGTPFSCSKEI